VHWGIDFYGANDFANYRGTLEILGQRDEREQNDGGNQVLGMYGFRQCN
jgi:hypothetical protein